MQEQADKGLDDMVAVDARRGRAVAQRCHKGNPERPREAGTDSKESASAAHMRERRWSSLLARDPVQAHEGARQETE